MCNYLNNEKMKCDGINCEDVKFFTELYNIMKDYRIHRIYSVFITKKRIVVAQQLLSTTMGNSKFSTKFFNFLDKYIPCIYFNIFIRFHILKYKLQLKKLFKKYDVEKISASSFELYQGIHITEKSLCIRSVDLVFRTGRVFHIDNLNLDI